MSRLLDVIPVLPRLAEMVEREGYRYVQIPLSGLWSGFFVFLFGILFCLVGLFLFFIWKNAARRTDQSMTAGRTEEEDGNVF